ncbi:MAG: class B sortase [Oscillospiraceae bacterium]|nr:class B sortase [Oscillospiraceae bacterium]
MKAKKFLLLGVVLFLFAVIGYSGYQLNLINSSTTQEAQVRERLMQYRPALPMAYAAGVPEKPPAGLPAASQGRINQSIIDLKEKHPGVVGWLRVPNTGIDHPFAQGDNNDYYLHIDLDKNYLVSGTLFMDYRNDDGFNDFNTIIFGHNMRNGSMFGTLINFDDEEFFNASSKGLIFAADETYEIEFMAWVVVAADDAVIYNSMFANDVEQAEFLDYVKSVARNYREIGAGAGDRFITLSTCNYEFDDARMALIGRIVDFN